MGARRCWSPSWRSVSCRASIRKRGWTPAAGRQHHCCAEPPRAHPHHNPPDRSRAPRLSGRVVLPSLAERKTMKKNILVSVDRGETRVAVLEAKGSPNQAKRRKKAAPSNEFKVAELYVERRGRRSIVGNIYKGKVDNVLPGMEAAFVDIGLERNGFLHVDEIVMPDGKAVPKRGRGKGRRIDELIKPGQEIVVQVVKDPLKTKGARLSMQLSIAGRYLVYMPQGGGIGVSKRLPDGERQRLRKLIEKVDIGKGGVIVRTAAQGGKKEDFVREISYLHRLDEIVATRAKESEVGQMIFQEADLSIRVVRDVLVEEFEGAIIDDPKQHERVTKFLQRTAPELADSVELYKDKDPLLEKWDVVKAFESTLNRRVDLPSGGYLMIDYAEALTVIDVNTGSFTGRGKGRLEDTITKVNNEAAEEVVRQVRLRDIGGIIVIAFIDMVLDANRALVLRRLVECLGRDRTKHQVAEVTSLGLVQMTRKRIGTDLLEAFSENCDHCGGRGLILHDEPKESRRRQDDGRGRGQQQHSHDQKSDGEAAKKTSRSRSRGKGR